jgi:HSP20 family molecular chaperone IbpA
MDDQQLRHLGRFANMSNDRPTQQQVKEATKEAAETRPPQNVPVNVYETPNALVVLAPMPAVTPGDVTVELTPGTVRFCAELRSAGPRDYLINEWDYGNYERAVDLPDGYGGGIEATLANGQLAIRVLKGDGAGTTTVKPGE